MELTLEQAKQFLASIGIAMPDFILQILVDQANTIDDCLIANGVPDGTALLIKLYLVGLYGVVQGDRYVTSQRAPSGAAQSFAYGTQQQKYNSGLALLNSIDTYGCATALIPADPNAKKAFLMVSTGGCGCE